MRWWRVPMMRGSRTMTSPSWWGSERLWGRVSSTPSTAGSILLHLRTSPPISVVSSPSSSCLLIFDFTLSAYGSTWSLCCLTLVPLNYHFCLSAILTLTLISSFLATHLNFLCLPNYFGLTIIFYFIFLPSLLTLSLSPLVFVFSSSKRINYQRFNTSTPW